MTTLVITVIGDDRPGLVSALADVITDHGGSWGRSQLAELAGKFAGIVTVDVADDRAEALSAAFEELHGVLETTVQTVGPEADEQPAEMFSLDLVGHDHPGIVAQISSVLAEQQVSVESLDTRVVPTPEAGGELFEARAACRAPRDVDVTALQRALEGLARELHVDITFDAEGQAAVWESSERW